MIMVVSTSHEKVSVASFDVLQQLFSRELFMSRKRLQYLDVETVLPRTREIDSGPKVDVIRTNARRQIKFLHLLLSFAVPLRIFR